MNYKKYTNILFNSTLVAQLFLIVIVAGIIIVFERFSDKESPKSEYGLEHEAALLIDFDNMKRMFVGEVVNRMTILDALNASVNAGEIKLLYYVDKNNNTRVEKINDHLANSSREFAFYLNSKKIESGLLNKVRVHPGDKITIRMEQK